MSLKIVQLADVSPAPWRNGGGSTRELLAWPSAERWALRLSVAEIERDGAFSSFHGIERWFAVIEGAGVELRFGSADRIRSVRRGDEVLQFDGGIAPACRLLDGPTQDLNLMLARGRGGLQRLSPGEPLLLRAPFKAVYVADAAVLHRAGAAPQPLAAGSLAWSDAAPGQLWTLEAEPGARAWSVAYEPAAEK
jgi:environmental stress-induced protein Ves